MEAYQGWIQVFPYIPAGLFESHGKKDGCWFLGGVKREEE